MGLGQGGLVTAVLRWPLVVELTLQARNLQCKEARAAGEAWAGIKAIWSVRPRLWRTQSGHQEIAESCPELQKDFPEPAQRLWGRRQDSGRRRGSALSPPGRLEGHRGVQYPGHVERAIQGDVGP